MKKKLSKVLAVVLSLVLAVGLAAVDGASVAQAAKKTKKLTVVKAGKRNVASGETRTITIKGTKAKKAKWSVKGDGASYVSLNKTKGKKVKMTVADNATGTVKVVAKLTKKNKVTVTYTLSCEATAITLADAEGYTNEAIALETTVTPSNATAVDVTYAVYTDEAATAAAEKATVADGALTATEAGTYYVVATAGTLTSNIAKVVVTDKLAKIESVKQTKTNEIEVTFDNDASKVTDIDLYIENSIGVRVNVKEIKLDDSKKVATVTTLVSMMDGKEYTVTYNESSAVFTATTGEVANIEVTPDSAPINTDVEVKAQALDVNGVLLAEILYGSNNAAYDFTIDIADGGSTDEANHIIRMETEGAKAVVTVVYHSNQFDANGEEIVCKAEKTIVAVAEGNISGYDKVGFVNYEDVTGKKYSEVDGWKLRDNIRVDGTNNGGADYTILALVKDDLGYTRVDGSLTEAGYTLSIADDTVALVSGDVITGVKEGKTYILVSKEEKVVFTIPVEVQAKSYLKSVETSASTVYLTAGNLAAPSERQLGGFTPDSATVTFKGYDQYGDEYEKFTVASEGANDNSKKTDVMYTEDDGSSVTVVAAGKDCNLDAGKYQSNTYTVTVTDTEFSDITISKKIYARVTMPKAEASSIKLVASATKVDTAVSSFNNGGSTEGNQLVTYKLGLYDSAGTLVQYEYLPSGASIEVKKNGTALKDATYDVADATYATISDNDGLAAGMVLYNDIAEIPTSYKWVANKYAGNAGVFVGNGDTIENPVDLAGVVPVVSDGAIIATGVNADGEDVDVDLTNGFGLSIQDDTIKASEADVSGGAITVSGSSVAIVKDGGEAEDTVAELTGLFVGGMYEEVDEAAAPAVSGGNDEYNFVSVIRDKFVGEFGEWNAPCYDLKKAATGTYQIRVVGIKFDKDNQKVVYDAEKTNVLSASLTVADTQKAITVGQEKKTTELTISDGNVNAIAEDTLRVIVPNGIGDWIPGSEVMPMAYDIVVDSYKITNNSLAITKITVYAPYQSNWYTIGRLAYTMNVSYTVKAAE